MEGMGLVRMGMEHLHLSFSGRPELCATFWRGPVAWVGADSVRNHAFVGLTFQGTLGEVSNGVAPVGA